LNRGKLNAIWMTPNERARGATLLSGGAPLGTALGAIVIASLITGLGSWRVRSPIVVVALLSVVLFFLRWCGVYWAIPSILATRDRAGFLGGCMNLGGNIAGITVPIIVGFIVQITGSYFLAMMFFAGAGIGLLICSTAIDYSRKLPI
jgi:ACS family D-galactonate transporter-like MFS transporter